MKSDFCLKCQQPGHTSDECPRKYPPAARLMVLLAGLLAVGPAPAISQAQAPVEQTVALPIPVSMAKACDADPAGCVLMPDAVYSARLLTAFEHGRRACRSET